MIFFFRFLFGRVIAAQAPGCRAGCGRAAVAPKGVGLVAAVGGLLKAAPGCQPGRR